MPKATVEWSDVETWKRLVTSIVATGIKVCISSRTSYVSSLLILCRSICTRQLSTSAQRSRRLRIASVRSRRMRLLCRAMTRASRLGALRRLQSVPRLRRLLHDPRLQRMMRFTVRVIACAERIWLTLSSGGQWSRLEERQRQEVQHQTGAGGRRVRLRTGCDRGDG